MTYSLNRRARGLALLLALACAAGSALSLTGVSFATTHLASIDALWTSCLRIALSAALAWATVVAAAAYRSIGGVDAPSNRSARLLASGLIAVAAWSFSGAASATVCAPPPASAVAVDTVPTPDFISPAAAQDERDTVAPEVSAAPQAPEPGWTPTAPPATAPADRTPLLMSGGATTADRTVVVRRGDSLWSIIGRHLGPTASADQIAALVPTWHDANRAVIGPDPDVLLVGQILTSPSTNAAVPQGGSR